MELSGTSLSYWSELSLEPVSGRKDVTATILYQRGIRMTEVKAFFLRLADVYAVCGSLYPLESAARLIDPSFSSIDTELWLSHFGFRREGHTRAW